MRKEWLLSLALLISISLSSCSESASVNEDDNIPDIEGLVWSDEFNGTTWDRDIWYPELGDSGWGNNEWQDYTPFNRNIEVSNGTLKIHALLEGNGQRVGDYTSARLLTSETFLYGRMEIRAKIPNVNGNGLWPAIWMLGDGIRNGQPWPDCGEIDIMEYVSYDPNKVHFSIHTAANNHKAGTAITSGAITHNTIEEEFHIYGLTWTEDYLEFYIDNPKAVQLRFDKPQNATNDNWPFDKPHFFLLNMAVGGDWGGAQGVDDSIFPATFEIDYVRVYELD
jgi:beta-glucanase (GH16 family)